MKSPHITKLLARHGTNVTVYRSDETQKLTEQCTAQALIQPVESRRSAVTERVGRPESALFTYIGQPDVKLPGRYSGVISAGGEMFRVLCRETHYFGKEAVYEFAALERWSKDE